MYTVRVHVEWVLIFKGIHYDEYSRISAPVEVVRVRLLLINPQCTRGFGRQVLVGVRVQEMNQGVEIFLQQDKILAYAENKAVVE